MRKQGWSGVLAELAELALVNQVDQLTPQVDDVTTDQLMTTPNRHSIKAKGRQTLATVMLLDPGYISYFEIDRSDLCVILEQTQQTSLCRRRRICTLY